MAGQSAWAIITIRPSPIVRNKENRIRKNSENRTPHHFSGLKNQLPFLPLPSTSQWKKKKWENNEKKKKEVGLKKIVNYKKKKEITIKIKYENE